MSITLLSTFRCKGRYCCTLLVYCSLDIVSSLLLTFPYNQLTVLVTSHQRTLFLLINWRYFLINWCFLLINLSYFLIHRLYFLINGYYIFINRLSFLIIHPLIPFLSTDIAFASSTYILYCSFRNYWLNLRVYNIVFASTDTAFASTT